MRLWFRVDASARIGAGHFMRCLAIAECWLDGGGTATFIGALPAGLRDRLDDEGIEHVSLDARHPDGADLERTRHLLPDRAAVVVDGYDFDADYEASLARNRRRVIVVDDVAHRPAYAGDLLLNFNLRAEELDYRRAPARRLLGPAYVPLRRRFRRWGGRRREVAAVAERLLVTLGAADPTRTAPRVLEGLAGPSFADATVRVIAGPANAGRDELAARAARSGGRVELLDDVADMPAALAWADFAISAAGGTTWELAFMGVPSGLIAVADNQRPNLAALLERGAALDLAPGGRVEPSAFAARVESARRDPRLRSRLRERGRELVDGGGAQRVVDAIRELLD